MLRPIADNCEPRPHLVVKCSRLFAQNIQLVNSDDTVELFSPGRGCNHESPLSSVRSPHGRWPARPASTGEPVTLASTIDRASMIWELGQAIIASRLNAILKKHKLSIKNEKPQKGLTLDRCRKVLLWELAKIEDLPHRDEMGPLWFTGRYYVRSDGSSIDELLTCTVERFRDRKWKEQQWRQLLIRPVEVFAARKRKEFSELAAHYNRTSDIGDECVYLGNGKLKIGNNAPKTLPATEDDVVRAILKNGGSAPLSKLPMAHGGCSLV